MKRKKCKVKSCVAVFYLKLGVVSVWGFFLDRSGCLHRRKLFFASDNVIGVQAWRWGGPAALLNILKNKFLEINKRRTRNVAEAAETCSGGAEQLPDRNVLRVTITINLRIFPQ